MIKSDRKLHDEFVQSMYETSRKRIAELEGEIVNIKQKAVISITAFTKRIAELEEEIVVDHKHVDVLLLQLNQLHFEHRWIPVSERLPENGGESILIFGVYDNAPSVWFCRYVFGFIPYDDLTDMDYFNVTHWMPLPQPPEIIV
jgi:hypothetical protein